MEIAFLEEHIPILFCSVSFIWSYPILSFISFYFSAVDDSSKELTESKAIDSLDDFYPEEPFETTDDEINDFVDAFEKSQEGDDPYINDLIEEPSEISPKENWAALPGNISFIFDYSRVSNKTAGWKKPTGSENFVFLSHEKT